MDKKQTSQAQQQSDDLEMNKNEQGVDKAPGEEQGKGELVTKNDLKNKTVDADPEEDSQQNGE